MSPAEEPMVRRLSTGGNRIRTVGSAGEVPDASCVRCPLCWHPLPLQKPKERTLVGPAEALPTGRHHPGMAGDIILERRARSNRNAERDHHGSSFRRSMAVAEGAEWERFAGLDLPPERLTEFLEGVPLAGSHPRRHDAALVVVPR